MSATAGHGRVTRNGELGSSRDGGDVGRCLPSGGRHEGVAASTEGGVFANGGQSGRGVGV